MPLKFSHESFIELAMVANTKSAFFFLLPLAVGYLRNIVISVKRNQTFTDMLSCVTTWCQMQSSPVSLFWLLNSPAVFAGELPTMSVCHRMFNRLQTFMGCSLKTAPFGQNRKKK